MMEKCVICGEDMPDRRRTCNAFPVREGRCCLFCDNMLVTPYRMALSGIKQHEMVFHLVKALHDNKDLTIRIIVENKGEEKRHDPAFIADFIKKEARRIESEIRGRRAKKKQ